MSTNTQRPAATARNYNHPTLGILFVLPLEVRLSIYEKAFEKSVATFKPSEALMRLAKIPGPHPAKTVPAASRFFTLTPEPSLLLVSDDVYLEALEIYWRQTHLEFQTFANGVQVQTHHAFDLLSRVMPPVASRNLKSVSAVPWALLNAAVINPSPPKKFLQNSPRMQRVVLRT
ncbi:hypothetical protein CMUS01_16272 [Colletotrichum musicola]|uniref:Uncharacterized protein n=1 Tax=Colletotrichum musicola TaxID=2175873 RepID=A0A8H6MJS9_9PEZI|nr:hypothetical protein CMUS01_16272 [Colletotrichum musicola]